MLAPNVTLDTFVMALAYFVASDNNPTPVYLNSPPNFPMSSSPLGCQMQKHQVVSMRMRDLTMLKQQQELTIKELEYKVENLNTTRHQFYPLLQATVQKLEDQHQDQAAQISQYVAEVQQLKETLKNQESNASIKANQYQAEIATLKGVISAGNAALQPVQDIPKLETEVKLLNEQIRNHEDSIDRQQSVIDRYESEIDELKNTISEHDADYKSYDYNSMPNVCDNIMRYVSEQGGRVEEFKQKIDEIRNVLANRLMGPAPMPARPPMPNPNDALRAMLHDCGNRVQNLENEINNERQQPWIIG